MTDAEEQTTTYTYDDLGRKLTEQYPDHVAMTSPGDGDYGIVAYAYDPAGRVLRKTPQTGDTITYVYDLAGRMTNRVYRTLANSPSGTITDQDEFAYDAAGRMLSAEKGRYSNLVERTYDLAGRPASESLTISGQTYTVEAEYGVETPTITLTYPDGSEVVKTLNSRGLLAEVERNSTPVVERTYTDAGRLSTQTFGNSVVETWTWTDDGLVESIDQPAGLFEYTYDVNHNRTSETITGALSAASWTTGESGFDADDRLVYRNQGSGTLEEEWDLSPVGDWDEYTENNTPVARTHGPTHEILTVGAATLEHDSRGNLTVDDQGQLLAWDFDNQLISVDTDADMSVDVEYVYDALARRVGRIEWNHTPTPPTSTTDAYVYWQFDVAAEYTAGSGGTSPLRSYVHGNEIDELVAMVDRTNAGASTAGTDEPLYYHSDAVTSVRALSDASGAIVELYNYTGYGAPAVLSPSLAPRSISLLTNAYCLTSRPYDHTARLLYMRYRWFSPQAGRFASRDPVHFIDGPSLYRGYFIPHASDPFGLLKGLRQVPRWLRLPEEPDPWGSREGQRLPCGGYAHLPAHGGCVGPLEIIPKEFLTDPVTWPVRPQTDDNCPSLECSDRRHKQPRRKSRFDPKPYCRDYVDAFPTVDGGSTGSSSPPPTAKDCKELGIPPCGPGVLINVSHSWACALCNKEFGVYTVRDSHEMNPRDEVSFDLTRSQKHLNCMNSEHRRPGPMSAICGVCCIQLGDKAVGIDGCKCVRSSGGTR